MNVPSTKPDVLEQQLRDEAGGIITNVAIWPPTNAPTEVEVVTAADTLHTYQQAVEQKEAELEQAQAVRDQYIEATAKPLYVKVRDQAYSTHGKNSDKILDYNLSKAKESTGEPPLTPTNPTIVQSNDGTAFIVTWKKVPKTKTYEVWYGVSTDAADDQTIPDMSFLDTSTKSSYIHIGIAKGSRYFYEIKAVNPNGKSELSPPESRVAN